MKLDQIPGVRPVHTWKFKDAYRDWWTLELSYDEKGIETDGTVFYRWGYRLYREKHLAFGGFVDFYDPYSPDIQEVLRVISSRSNSLLLGMACHLNDHAHYQGDVSHAPKNEAMELVDGLDLELLDKQISALHELEEDNPEISGILNFLCPLYSALGGE